MPAIRIHFVLPVLLTVACHIEKAPADVDGLSRWLWVSHKSALDADILDAVRKLDAAAGPLEEDREETISRLLPGDLKAAGVAFEGDVSKAAGMLLLNTIHCPLDRVEKLFIQRDQKALHANYISYERTFTAAESEYLARRVNPLDWNSTYQLQLLIPIFKPTVPGGARFVPAATADEAPLRGPAFLGFASFDGPAVVVTGGDDAFKQNYQVQLFYERSPGSVVHLYALWQELKVGYLTSDGADVASITLSSLKKSDDDYQTHCND